jgi:membrane-associated phospholipid phosphatase
LAEYPPTIQDREKMLRLIRSASRSIVTAIRRNPCVVRHYAAHPAIWRFVARRFSPGEPFGLRVTIGAVTSFLFLYLFLAIVEDLIFKDPMVDVDLRVMSLLQIFRAPAFNGVMVFFTYLGNWEIVGIGALLLAVYLALSRRWLWLATLLVSVIGGEGIVSALKSVTARPRPDLANALLPAQGLSFPSGHTFFAIAFYGFIAWFAIDRVKVWWGRSFLAGVAAVGIGVLGFSRIYLGVHWPSDVLASLAAGAAWLTILITVLAVTRALGVRDTSQSPNPVWQKTAAVLLPLIWAGVVVAYYGTHPLVARAKPEPQLFELPESAIAGALSRENSSYIEDIAGVPMQPINVMIVGPESDLQRALADAAWQPTDPISIKSSWRLLFTVLLDRAYPRAPGIPNFWRGKPTQLAFAQPMQNRSARERHHLQLWPTSLTVAGQPVWLGTLHFDRLTFATGRAHTDKIDPTIDEERDHLRQELRSTRCVQRIGETTIAVPMSGGKAAGSPFVTDGKTMIVTLECP